MLTPSHGRREGYRNLDLDGTDTHRPHSCKQEGISPSWRHAASAVGDIQKLAYLASK